ncbi:hypothetical protein ANN_26263 [Periplaneta americana]|uniref:Uncharacterized protein n=1 Tax=Periplaneta americana TaxID=6978 RepID=A0ABQ8S5Y9_PERAM|nr:hypothetical protein ANN_26263 [Periplaneta americana]
MASDRMKVLYDRLANSAGFQEGDLVWLYRPTRTKGKSPKLQRAWDGPYRVVTWINDVVYRIQRQPRGKMMEELGGDSAPDVVNKAPLKIRLSKSRPAAAGATAVAAGNVPQEKTVQSMTVPTSLTSGILPQQMAVYQPISVPWQQQQSQLQGQHQFLLDSMQQLQLRPSLSTALGTLEPATLLASIQKIIAENEQLRVELEEKRTKIDEQNEKMYQLWIQIRRLLLVDIMPHGTTINSDAYVTTLKKLQARLSHVQPHREKQNVLLLHDNAWQHVSHKTTD